MNRFRSGTRARKRESEVSAGRFDKNLFLIICDNNYSLFSDAVEDVMADDLIGLQNRNWEKIETSLNDHYKFEKKDDAEKFIRTTLETARKDLERRQNEIKLLVTEKE